MSRIAYVNGRYVPIATASINIEDRGFQFGDAVYDVWSYCQGVLADFSGHLERLKRSLGEIEIKLPISEPALHQVLLRVARVNRLKEGIVYIQISRGAASREHGFPDSYVKPTLVITAKPVSFARMEKRAQTGVAVVTCPDERWARCDIKTVNLLPNVLAKQTAKRADAYEAWLVDANGRVTEGTSTTAWIINDNKEIQTRTLDHHVLPGVTRESLIRIIAASGYKLIEGGFTPSDVLAAKEAFLTSATNFVMPVVSLDGEPVGDGRPGPETLALRGAYLRSIT